MVTKVQDPAAYLVDALGLFRDLLASHKAEIDRLNVFPVPDGDTGTNMTLTVNSVVSHLAGVDTTSLAEVTRAVSMGSLLGARGNSGVILSQLLKGVAESFATLDGPLSSVVLAEGLIRGSKLADSAVLRPKEGTILTVARAGASGAMALVAEGRAVGVDELLTEALKAARTSLVETTDQLEQLKKADVVDSGGAGLIYLFEALLATYTAQPLPAALSSYPWLERAKELEGPSVLEARDVERAEEEELRYEVMYLLEAEEPAVSAMKEVWAGLGDSIVVVGFDGVFNCHIHTNEIGAAIEAGIGSGQVRDIRVTDLREQVEEERWVRTAGNDAADEQPMPRVNTAVVAVANGEGLKRIFVSMRVNQVVLGGQSMNPSTEDLLDAISACNADSVIVLPNNSNIIASAKVASTLAEVPVKVMATTNVLEGFSALMEYDPDASLEENFESMSSVATELKVGEVTRAVRDSEGIHGHVLAGQWIGLSQSGIEVCGDLLPDVVIMLVKCLLGDGHEILTLIEGEGSSPAATRAIKEAVVVDHPNLIVEVHYGGQPLYPYLVGVE